MDACPHCGAKSESGACPACLMRLALDLPTEGERPALADDPFAPGETIGPYRIEAVLGQGGMGIVYQAEQREPIRRSVALKVIKRGMESRQVVARFEAERQALALMDHPAIAAVYEAGQTDDGRPYFVMERVEGLPVNVYCDERGLETSARLELFARICDGVQHAHRKGVIHRDLKPSNILVSEVDGEAQPKIIDFGIAKAIEQPLTEGTLFTELGVLVGTPEYMSPEQAELSPLQVDTRSDVYSLGVILYELLSGRLPFERSELRELSFEEIRRRLREGRPSKPSVRIREGDAIAGPRLSGDLDVITMKALERSPERRYESPAEFAADVRRYLAGEPVLARAPTPWYLLRSFVARHRTATAVAALFLVTLLGFSIWMTVLYRASQANLARALDAETEAATVSEFMIGVFEVNDPGQSRGEQTSARELLDRARERIGSDLSERPELRGTLLTTLGRVYGSLGMFEQAQELYSEAVELRPESAQTHRALAMTHVSLGDYERAARLAERAAELASDGDAVDRVELEHLWARIRAIEGRYEEALAHAQKSHELALAALGRRDEQVAGTYKLLANVLLALSRYEEAEQAASAAVEIFTELRGADDPSVLSTKIELAEIFRRKGHYEEAERVYLEILEGERRIYDADHPSLAYVHNNLGIVYRRMDRLDEAIANYREAIRIREVALPPNHPLLAWTLDNLGVALRHADRFEEAEAVYERALAIADVAVGKDHPDYAVLLNNGALMERDRGNDEKAATMWRRAIAIHEKAGGPDHPRLADPLYSLAGLARGRGDRAEAERLYRRSLQITVDAYGEEHPDAVDTRNKLDALLADGG